jgi:hypothetical protein
MRKLTLRPETVRALTFILDAGLVSQPPANTLKTRVNSCGVCQITRPTRG